MAITDAITCLWVEPDSKILISIYAEHGVSVIFRNDMEPNVTT